MSITLPVSDFVTAAEDAADAISAYVVQEEPNEVTLNKLMDRMNKDHPEWDQLTLSRGLVRALRDRRIAPTTPAADAFVVGDSGN